MARFKDEPVIMKQAEKQPNNLRCLVKKNIIQQDLLQTL
jgi:hypothetical protein